jgi:hypothetical protein
LRHFGPAYDGFGASRRPRTIKVAPWLRKTNFWRRLTSSTPGFAQLTAVKSHNRVDPHEASWDCPIGSRPGWRLGEQETVSMFGRHFWYGALCVIADHRRPDDASQGAIDHALIPNRGSSAGSSVTRGNSTRFSDDQGRFSGSAFGAATRRRSTTRVAITPDYPSTVKVIVAGWPRRPGTRRGSRHRFA